MVNHGIENIISKGTEGVLYVTLRVYCSHKRQVNTHDR